MNRSLAQIWASLLSESRRNNLATVLALIVGLALALGFRLRGGNFQSDFSGLYLTSVAAFLVAYVVLTWLAFTQSDRASIDRWAGTLGPVSAVDRWVKGKGSVRPGVNIAVSVSFIALVVAVVWLPQLDDLRLLGGWGELFFAIVTIIFSWLSVPLTYAVAYLVDDVRSAGTAFDFPGGQEPLYADYLYLALAVSTSLASTDVRVLRSASRRLVATHTVIAFVFNTVILAALVSLLVRSL